MQYTVYHHSLIASLYKSDLTNSPGIIIRAPGMPDISSNGKCKNPELFYDQGYDLIIPEYYGWSRSDGIFTPQGCIQTIIDIYTLCQGGKVIDIFSNQELQLQYETIHVIGTSFGGGIVASLPAFDKRMSTIGMIAPVLDFQALGKYGGDQSVDDVRSIMKYGYSHLYRGFDKPVRDNYFQHRDSYHPLANLSHWSSKNIFIAHGQSDTSIDYRHTKSIVDSLPDYHITTLYETDANHNSIKEIGFQGFLEFINNLKSK